MLHAEKLIRRTSAHRRLIIMYHGVTQRDQFSINGRNLSVSQFEQQLQYFKKNFDIVPLKQLFQSNQLNEIPGQYTIALTFDDGLENNFLNVLPLLEKYKVPASFFISTVSLGNENYVLPAEMIEIIRAATKEKILELGNYRFVKKGKYGLLHEGDHLSANMYMMQMHPHERTEILNEFAARYQFEKILSAIDRECWKLMNADQVRETSASGWVEIGSHSHEHYSLTHLNDEEAEHELRISKELLQTCLGKPVDTIAYPFGMYDERVKLLSRKCGYQNLLAAGTVKHDESDILPRVGVWNTEAFAYNMLWINRAFTQFGF